jgi:HlyD family type I secretion membrane fusion protein
MTPLHSAPMTGGDDRSVAPSQTAAESIDITLKKRANRALWLVAFMIFGVFGLMAFFPIEGAVIAAGSVAVESRIKTISHAQGGVLSAIYVKEGDRVEAGQELMRLDPTIIQSSANVADLGRAQSTARKARLEAVRDGAASITFPAALANMGAEGRRAMDREQRQFTLERNEQISTVGLLRQRGQQYREQIISYRAQISAALEQLALIRPELEGLRTLKERGLVTINRLNTMERTAVDLKARVASLNADIASAEAQISQTEEQIIGASQSRRVQAAAELGTVVSQLTELEGRSTSADDSLKRTIIRAPQSGVIDNLTYATIGSAVPPAQPIARIVPDADTLVIDGQASPIDIDNLRIGQPVRVRFSVLEEQLAPEINGTLIFVAPERVTDPNNGVAFFPIRVEVSDKELAKIGGRNAVRAGLPVELFLTTGSRSMLMYLVQPLINQLRRAMRE